MSLFLPLLVPLVPHVPGRQQQQHGLCGEFLRGKLRPGPGGCSGWRATDGGQAAVAAVATPEGGDGVGWVSWVGKCWD